MIRRPPRSTLDRSSAASDVYKRQVYDFIGNPQCQKAEALSDSEISYELNRIRELLARNWISCDSVSVSYTHLRAHETVLDLVCRLLLEKTNKQKKKKNKKIKT